MANTTARPSCWANVLTGKPDSTPIWLPNLLEAQSAITIAPAVGTARLVFADSDGRWTATFKPNDILRLVFSSRRKQVLAQQGTTPSWTGLVDRCYALYDPRAPYGRACVLEASTFWKALLITSVPFSRIGRSVPRGNLTNVALINMALSDVKDNIGLALNFANPPSLAQQSPFWTVPTQQDFMDPGLNSWASYLTANAVMAGNELFFNEAGDLILQETQFARSSTADVVLNKEDLLTLQAGVTDDGLTTDVVVTYGIQPRLETAGVAPGQSSEGPGGMDAAGNWDIGPLPDSLKDANGKPLPRLGKRFQALYVPWLADRTAAARYAAIIRTIGLASVNQALATGVLNGDLTIGQLVQTAVDPTPKRYYLTSVHHQWMMGQDAMTQMTLRYGIDANKAWDRTDLASYSTAGLAIAPPTRPAATASLPAQGSNPSVLWVDPVLTHTDIQTILAGHQPSCPFVDQSQLIWRLAQQYHIDPAFALAVWQIETQMGSDGSAGAEARNPGNIGPGIAYATWADGITAWFVLIAGPLYVGAGLTTVGDIGQRYAPPSDGNVDWVPNVAATMARYRNYYQGAANGVIAQAQAVVSGTATSTNYGTATAIPGSKRAALVALAQKQLGVPYSEGFQAPGVSFDCSGLMRWCYSQVGIPIPRVAQDQHDYCQQIEPSQLQPGDLVFFTNTYDAGTPVTHVGMWVGPNKMIDAEKVGVGIVYDTPFDGGYWESHFYSAGRVPGLDGG